MFNKTIMSFTAVLFVVMSVGILYANTSDYAPVPKDSNTQVAYIDQLSYSNGKYNVDVDFIEWYEGEAANQKFQEIEQDPEMTEAPDGYYIVNQDNDLAQLEIASDAEVFMQIYDRTGNIVEAGTNWNEEISVKKFVSLFSNNSDMNMKDFPYHLTVKNDKIVKITQQFIP